jgi:hypothetical protein
MRPIPFVRAPHKRTTGVGQQRRKVSWIQEKGQEVFRQFDFLQNRFSESTQSLFIKTKEKSAGADKHSPSSPSSWSDGSLPWNPNQGINYPAAAGSLGTCLDQYRAELVATPPWRKLLQQY